MKTVFFTTALALTLCSCVSIFAQDKNLPAKKQPETIKTEQQKDSAYYTCSMHPEIHSDKPGKCSKCGMTLIKESSSQGKKEKKHKMKMGCGMMEGMGDMENVDKSNPDQSQQNNSVSDSTKSGTIIYTCSMHPEIQSYKPAYCQKCGMKLSEMKKK